MCTSEKCIVLQPAKLRVRKLKPIPWRHGLRRGSAADRLLGLRVRNPPGTWMSLVSVVCWQVEISTSGRSLDQRSPTECVCLSVIGCKNNPLHLQWVGGKR